MCKDTKKMAFTPCRCFQIKKRGLPSALSPFAVDYLGEFTR